VKPNPCCGVPCVRHLRLQCTPLEGQDAINVMLAYITHEIREPVIGKEADRTRLGIFPPPSDRTFKLMLVLAAATLSRLMVLDCRYH
jgi:hypothetical protein